MNLELFTNEYERTNFLNYKANLRIRTLEKIIEKEQQEITNNIDVCEKIFLKYNNENVISKVIEIDNKINNILNDEYDEDKITELNQQRDSLSFDLKTFLENLMKKYKNENFDFSKKSQYLKDKEDIEFAYKKIVSRTMSMQDRISLIKMIEQEYPFAREFDVETYQKNSTIFNWIYENTVKEIKDNQEIDLSNNLYVTKISEAPIELIQEEKDLTDTYNEDIKQEIESEPVIDIQSDTSFFGIDDSLTEAILNNQISFEEVEEVKPDELPEIPLDVVIEPVKEEKELVIENTQVEEIKKEATENITIEDIPTEEINNELIPVEEPILEDTPQNELIQIENVDNQKETNIEEKHTEDNINDQLTYTVDERDTLYSIAYALFVDEKLTEIAIQKILEENKEIIGKRLTERNITDYSNIDKEQGIFNGLTLNLTNVFEKVIAENNKEHTL